jgi:Flp pilus assembly protein TadD
VTLPSRLAFGHCILSVLLLLSLNDASAQTSGSISGSVRDSTGSALPGISLTLSESGSATSSMHTTTDKFGAFHFDHIALGSYRFSSDQPGDTIAPNGPVMLSLETPVLHRDLTLTSASDSPYKPQPAPQLQAAGIRGYIDPGGYSAPAGAAAASKLIQGAADLNRPSNNADQDIDAACWHETALLKAVHDRPENAAVHRRLGQYYLAQHQLEKALAEFQRARMLDEHDPETLVSLAVTLLQTRQFAKAHDLLVANASGADQAEIHRLLARSDEGVGAFQQASLEYQVAAALEPTEANFYGAGYELILAGSAAAAVMVFDAGTARYPESITLTLGMGTADFLLGQSAEATRIFLRCAMLHPDDSRLYPFLSASFTISGIDPDAVESTFARYYQLHPEDANAAYFYALMLVHRNSADTIKASVDAETLLKRAIQLEPLFAKAHLQLGNVYLDGRDYTHAAEEFATALRLDPGLWETRYKLSAAYKRTGQLELADQQMRLFLAKKSQNASENQASGPQLEEFLSVFAKPDPKPNPHAACAVRN